MLKFNTWFFLFLSFLALIFSCSSKNSVDESIVKNWHKVTPKAWAFNFLMPSEPSNTDRSGTYSFGEVDREVYSSKWGDSHLSATKSIFPAGTQNILDLDIQIVKNLTRFIEIERQEGMLEGYKFIKINAKTEGGPRPLKLDFLWLQDTNILYSFSSIAEIYAKESIDHYFGTIKRN